jgi:hypothetical protein
MQRMPPSRVTSRHVSSLFGTVFTIAVLVRLGAGLLGLDRDAPGWIAWRSVVIVALLSLAALWLVAVFREHRAAAGGARALLAPWAVPVAVAAGLVGVLVAFEVLL